MNGWEFFGKYAAYTHSMAFLIDALSTSRSEKKRTKRTRTTFAIPLYKGVNDFAFFVGT